MQANVVIKVIILKCKTILYNVQFLPMNIQYKVLQAIPRDCEHIHLMHPHNKIYSPDLKVD